MSHLLKNRSLRITAFAILNAFVASRIASGQQGFAWATAPGGNYTYLSSEWTVPPYPPIPTDQAKIPVISFWNGLEPADESCVMQPVVSSNGHTWTIYSFVCCPANNTRVPNCYGSGKPAIAVNAGDTINGTMELDQNSNLWTITTTDVSSKQSDVMSVSPDDVGGPQMFAIGGALETLNLTACGYLPANGQITFGSTAKVNFGPSFMPNFLPQPTYLGSNVNCQEYVTGSANGVSIFFSTGNITRLPSPPIVSAPTSSSSLPVISSVPSSVTQGQLVTLSGTGFLYRNTLWVTSQNGTNGIVVISTDGETITFSTPAREFPPGLVTFYLSNANGSSNSRSFTTLAVQ
jgi:hypothetical protein